MLAAVKSLSSKGKKKFNKMRTLQASQVPFASTSTSFSSPPAPKAKTLSTCKSVAVNLKLNRVCSLTRRKNGGGGVLVVVGVGKEEMQQEMRIDEDEEDLQCVRQIQRVIRAFQG